MNGAELAHRSMDWPVSGAQGDTLAAKAGGIEIERLTVRFGSRTVLDDLSLSIGRGEFLTVLGRSGCGKTTISTNLACAFAVGGATTALADCDRQGSSLMWLKSRRETVASIQGLDWRKDVTKIPETAHGRSLLVQAVDHIRPAV